PAPVVPDHDRGPRADLPDQRRDVFDQDFRSITVHTRRLVRFVVTPQVRGHDAATGRRQSGNLVPPGVPKLGKSVQQEYRGTLALLHVMKADAVDDGPAVLTDGGLADGGDHSIPFRTGTSGTSGS